MLELVRPCEEYLDSYTEAREECLRERPERQCSFADPTQVIRKAYNFEHGIDLKPGRVRMTVFWLVDGERFLGEICIRHALTPTLTQYGGHIGYEVRPSACRRGYGRTMLAMVLPYCKEILGLDRVLITCDDDNIGSQKIIERNGGMLENKVTNHLERGTVLTRKYWISLV